MDFDLRQQTFKGVMMCNRPFQKGQTQYKSLPFVSRVDPKDQIGINPIHRFKQKPLKKESIIYQKHQNLLNEMNLKNQLKKSLKYQNKTQMNEDKIQRFQSIDNRYKTFNYVKDEVQFVEDENVKQLLLKLKNRVKQIENRDNLSRNSYQQDYQSNQIQKPNLQDQIVKYIQDQINMVILQYLQKKVFLKVQ